MKSRAPDGDTASSNLYLPSEYFSGGFDNVDSLARLLADHGVRRTSITIITGRSGTTLLSHICKSYGFGMGEEPFNERPVDNYVQSRGDFSVFVSQLLSANVIDGNFYFQITPARFRSLSTLVPIHYWREFGTAVSLVFRRNIFAQAISFCNALSTGVWHASQPAVSGNGRAYDGLWALEWVRTILNDEIEARRLASQIRDGAVPILYYEDLVTATFESVIAFLSAHRVDVDAARVQDAIQTSLATASKIERSGYVAQYQELRRMFTYADGWLIERIRSGSSDALCRNLIDALEPVLGPSSEVS
jgi:LPS sulfotransferase NodH